MSLPALLTFNTGLFTMQKRYTIFYTDDDADDRQFFTEIVGDNENVSSIHTQSSGDELLKVLHNPPPAANLVFLDLNMPIKNGYEVLKEIRTSPDLKDVPVIILSTSNDAGSVNRAKSLGANLYVAKPGTFEDFKKIMDRVVSIDWYKHRPSEQEFFISVN